jgi:hypothetical protein
MDDQEQELRDQCQRAWQRANGHRLEAVHFLRKQTGLGLREAIAAFERAGFEMNTVVLPPEKQP